MDQDKTTSDNSNGEGKSDQPQLVINRIYVKDVSFEVPMSADAFAREWQPMINQDTAINVHKLGGDQYQVELHITVSVREEARVLCLVEVQQVGIFMIAGVDGQQLAQVLNTHCPAILFPYARELIDNLVVRGTFPAVMLPPVNFDAIFQNSISKKSQPATSSAD